MSDLDIRDLITANHILHHRSLVDAYGHISLRDPNNSTHFIMSSDRAPALVSSRTDLVTYHVTDATPVDPHAKKGYSERFIHSEIYKRFPHINSVIHSHSETVLPFTIAGVAMKPVFHLAGFLGSRVPNWDICPLYEDGDVKDLLVRSVRLGEDLAKAFSKPGSQEQDHNVVLMANHGFTTLGTSVQQAVFRAVYTHTNATVQRDAILLRSASGALGAPVGEMRVLVEGDVVEGCTAMGEASRSRPWNLWVKEVESTGLYCNEEREGQ